MKKKIIVVSDSHGNYGRLRKIIDQERPFDFLIHCGDGAGDTMHAGVPEESGLVRVLGNVDLSRELDLARSEFIEINNKKILIVHGDHFGVNNSYELIRREGKAKGAELILFGHTHNQYLENNRPLLFNPGTASRGFYGVIEIDDSFIFSHRHVE